MRLSAYFFQRGRVAAELTRKAEIRSLLENYSVPVGQGAV